jgi:hypothetical protein
MESDEDYYEFEFSKQVCDNSPAGFDVSSALQAVASKHILSVQPTERNEYIKFRIEAYDEWMTDGRSSGKKDYAYYPGIVNQQSRNLLSGTDTGEGWITPDGGAVMTDGHGGLYAEDKLMSPIVTVDYGKDYTFSFSTQDESPKVFYFDERGGYYEELQVSAWMSPLRGKMYKATFRDIQGDDIRMVIQTKQGFYYSGIKLEEGIEPAETVTEYLYLYAFQGSMTDAERLRVSDETGVAISRWTRKPESSPEIVFLHETIIRPKSVNLGIGMDTVDSSDPKYPQVISGAPTMGPASEIYTADTEGLCVFHPDSDDRFSVYAIPVPRNAVQLRFVNGLGCLESVHLYCQLKKEANISTVQHVIARQETLTQFSRSLAVKQPGREKWVLSSPPLDEQWASWYIHELLTARWAWIAVTGIAAAAETWIPVIILPEETTTLIDRAKGGTTTVQITVELGIDGSPIL